jgi:hypothetical protein
MTMPDERFDSVILTHAFLLELATGKPQTWIKVRERAQRLLRHYPARFEMEETAFCAPKIFKATPRPRLAPKF